VAKVISCRRLDGYRVAFDDGRRGTQWIWSGGGVGVRLW